MTTGLAERLYRASDLPSADPTELPTTTATHVINCLDERLLTSNSGISAAAFGGVALVAVLFFGEGIPRVQNDVLKKIPVVNEYWLSKKPVPASDSVSFSLLLQQLLVVLQPFFLCLDFLGIPSWRREWRKEWREGILS